MATTDQRSSTAALELIQGSLSAGRIARRSPLVGGLHRLADGTLLGVFGALAVLAGLTLHWQHRWTVAFQQLEATKLLSHRLTESTALLEQHLLKSTTRPSSLVPTKVSNLIYIDRSELSDSVAGEQLGHHHLPPSSGPQIRRLRQGY
ncbi:MAG: hypothetical protein VKI93_05640 [Synechococcus sp.]|nr:hypothetical protein [Synechococcus sp.]